MVPYRSATHQSELADMLAPGYGSAGTSFIETRARHAGPGRAYTQRAADLGGNSLEVVIVQLLLYKIQMGPLSFFARCHQDQQRLLVPRKLHHLLKHA